jgi:two-component system, cell cycle sensor histidine kinase and response regulator CckA
MRNTLRVLFVSAGQVHPAQVQSCLSELGFACDLQSANTADLYLKALTGMDWELILCEHPHPCFTDFHALREAQELQPQSPFLYLATSPELIAGLGALKQGAMDYVPADCPELLRPAIDRALKVADGRKAQLQANRQLQEQASLLDLTQDGILVIDLEGQILRWNKGAEQLFGWTAEEALGKSVYQFLKFATHELFSEYVHRLLATSEWNGELTKHTRQGHSRIVQSRWSLMHEAIADQQAILMVDTDVTDRKRMEAQLLRAQRLESIGTLAGGIAHDLNNVLAPILLSVQTLREELTSEAAQSLLDTVESSARRGSSIIKQVLTFARGTQGEQTAVAPEKLIQQTLRLLLETFPKSIHFQTEIPDGVWMIHGEASQLQQVLMNLALNARDAMPSGGLLKIHADNVWVDENLVRLLPDARTGPFVLFEVTDTGAGIAPDKLEKIFDPFFSTKDPDKGTGLGLSTALGIIKSHRGFIQVESQLNVGSKFKIFLPAVAAIESCLETGSAPELLRGQGQTILVVDDEESVRDVTRRTLERYGYQVITASDGAEAVALFAKDPAKVDLVLTDLMMPFMDGAATIRALRRMKPEVRLVVASGLASQARVGEVQHLQVQAVLRKPFNAESLLTTVYKVIHHASLIL